MVLLEQDQRWDLVHQLLHDTDLDPTTRVAGLLVLLFGQPLTRIVRIRTDQITQSGHGVTLALGDTPVVLPPPLDELVVGLVQKRHGHAAIGRTGEHPWLFPGGTAGQPISSRQLMRRLQTVDIRSRPARNTTLMDLAAELPAVVLSRLLGIHINSATRWTREAGTPMSDYAAEVSRRPTRR
jgi:hypothetical protein